LPDLDSIRADLSAFADDEDEVVIDTDGAAIFTRGGIDVSCRFRVGASGDTVVEIEGSQIPYHRFLTHHLARLPILAERLRERRPDIDAFVDGPATIDSASAPQASGRAMAVLDGELTDGSPFATKVVFITADAGHGKTALLRHVQSLRADAFVKGTGQSLFWHVDLQGRQLLRLHEALMGDVAELRVPGLWMPGVIRLLQHRALILGIDGFDELAAEQGTSNALGALAHLVRQLQGRGMVVAASRRAFFDADSYVTTSRLFRQMSESACEFDQVSLGPWKQPDAVAFLSQVTYEGRGFEDPNGTFTELVQALHGEAEHVMVSRPFLLTHIARGLLRYGIAPAGFIQAPGEPMGGVQSVVMAFIRREVSDKWVFADTGLPYLTVDQHLILLASVAEEMYLSHTDRLGVDILETIAGTLMDDWHTDLSKRPQVMAMVKAHVLLIPSESDSSTRQFDHPAFRDYFVAVALRDRLQLAAEGKNDPLLIRLLAAGQLSDSTADFVAGMLDVPDAGIRALCSQLCAAASAERRATFLPINCGTLVAYLIAGREFADGRVQLEAPFIYSSVIFDRKTIHNVDFIGSSFVNASVCGSQFESVMLDRCDMGELLLDEQSVFTDVSLRNSTISGLRLRDGMEERREYAPSRIAIMLAEVGLVVEDNLAATPKVAPPAGDMQLYQATRKLLRLFQKTTLVNSAMIETRAHGDAYVIVEEVIPVLIRHGIMRERPWTGSGRNLRLFSLNHKLETVLAAEDRDTGPLGEFWREIKSRRTDPDR
jgi:hypothetical protein